MDSAATLFGSSSLNGMLALSPSILYEAQPLIIFYTIDDPLSMNCSSKDDFTVLAETLSDLLIEKHSSSPHFTHFVEQFSRSILSPVKPEDAKKVRVAIAKVVEEKEKAAKNGGKGVGLGGKPSLGTGKALARGKEDLSSFGEALDDDVAANDYDPDDDFVSDPFSLSHIFPVP